MGLSKKIKTDDNLSTAHLNKKSVLMVKFLNIEDFISGIAVLAM